MKSILLIALTFLAINTQASEYITPSVSNSDTCVFDYTRGGTVYGECVDKNLNVTIEKFYVKTGRSMAAVIQSMANQGLSLTGIANYSNTRNILTFQRK